MLETYMNFNSLRLLGLFMLYCCLIKKVDGLYPKTDWCMLQSWVYLFPIIVL
jgi:hypothetical protein